MYRTQHTGSTKYFPIFGKISSLSAKEIRKSFLRVSKYVRESLYASIDFSGKLPSGAAWRAQFRQHNDPSIVRTILFSAHSALFRSILSDIWSSPGLYTPLHAGMQSYTSSYTFSASCMPSPFVSYV